MQPSDGVGRLHCLADPEERTQDGSSSTPSADAPDVAPLLAIPHRLAKQPVEVLDGSHLVGATGNPAASGAGLGVEAVLVALPHARPPTVPGHAVVQRHAAGAALRQ